MKYRNTLQITAELLDITKDSGMNGIGTTNLIQKNNISHSRLKPLLSSLTSSGLVNEIKYDGRNTFVITEKGQLLLEQYKKFSDLAGTFGLEM